MSQQHYVVVLINRRNPYDGEGGLRIVRADSPEAAVREAHPKPPSTTRVTHAWVHALAAPYQPTMIPADVPAPEWGKPKRGTA